MTGKITDARKLAHEFMSLDPEGFRMFWATVGLEWNQEDGDLEAQWFFCGQKMRPLEVTVIGALHSAVASGQKAGREGK